MPESSRRLLIVSRPDSGLSAAGSADEGEIGIVHDIESIGTRDRSVRFDGIVLHLLFQEGEVHEAAPTVRAARALLVHGGGVVISFSSEAQGRTLRMIRRASGLNRRRMERLLVREGFEQLQWHAAVPTVGGMRTLVSLEHRASEHFLRNRIEREAGSAPKRALALHRGLAIFGFGRFTLGELVLSGRAQ